jgi:hypothetical protein
MSFIVELWAYMAARKKFWLLPLIVILLLVGGLTILVNSSTIAPFIYTIF